MADLRRHRCRPPAGRTTRLRLARPTSFGRHSRPPATARTERSPWRARPQKCTRNILIWRRADLVRQMGSAPCPRSCAEDTGDVLGDPLSPCAPASSKTARVVAVGDPCRGFLSVMQPCGGEDDLGITGPVPEDSRRRPGRKQRSDLVSGNAAARSPNRCGAAQDKEK